MIHAKTSAEQAVKGGVIAGLVGGVLLALLLIILTASQGGDIWVAMKGAAAPFIGAAAFEPGFAAWPVIMGVLSHLAVSLVWGVIFGLVAHGWSKRMTLLSGIPFGVAVWLGMYYMLLPMLGMAEVAQSSPVWMAIFTHVFFGLCVSAAFLPFQVEAPERHMVGVTGTSSTGTPLGSPFSGRR